MTENRASSLKPAPKAAAPAARAAAKPTSLKSKAARSKAPAGPKYRHPNLGLAPVDLEAGYPAAAEKIRDNALRISAGGLETATIADPTFKERYDEAGLRQLLRDGELLAERLASCVASGEDRWLTEYAEWVVPIYRRRGVPLRDLSALCAGMRDTLEPQLAADEFAVASRSLDAAADVLRRNGRIAGDRHTRNALWRWMYRGV